MVLTLILGWSTGPAELIPSGGVNCCCCCRPRVSKFKAQLINRWIGEVEHQMSHPGPDEPSTSTGGVTVQGVSGGVPDSPPAKRAKLTIPDVSPEEALDEVQALMDNCLDYEVFRDALDTVNMDQFREMINLPSVDLGHVVRFHTFLKL